ncbi:MAG: type 1 glutamine amidotransferase domain-containing protein, partial [Candidatus Eisenbacteria bacterium]|nr:type 1 glutamine amidotransferase domain-containing protein [Candidatus Eisenbacteria bacterium]
MAQSNRLEGLRIAILATDGVEEVELTDPKEALEEAGGKTEVIAPHSGPIQGFRHHDKANRIEVQGTLDRADPDRYDAVLLPGGALNADALRADPAAQDFVRRIDEARKPIAVICHGPWLLISAGLVRGRRLTSFFTIQDDVRNAGGQWLDQEMVRDRNWVSSRSPEDLPAFD